jgi:hypothetical protein
MSRRTRRAAPAARSAPSSSSSPRSGAAIVTGIYFKVSAADGGVTAMTVSSFTVAMIIVACVGLVWLLPRKAAEG